MWRRFKRVVQSNLGRLSDVGGRGLTGDLDREAKELERALRRAGDGLVTVKGEVTFLEEKARKLARREAELAALEEAAIGRGAEEAAGSYALELARVRAERATTERQLEVVREALERGQLARAALQAQREQKLIEARERERALLALERDDALGGGLHAEPEPSPAPRLEPQGQVEVAPPRKTVGGPLPTAAPAPSSGGRSVKTIGPEPPSPTPAASSPPSSPGPAGGAPPAALKIRIRSREGDTGQGGERPGDPAAATSASAVERSAGLDDPQGSPRPAAGELTAGGAVAPPAADLVGELERLAALRAQGVLTDEELEQAKRRLLGSGAGA